MLSMHKQATVIEAGLESKYHDPTTMDDAIKPRTRRSRRIIWIVAAGIIFVALAIGLGVGLGLTLGGNDDNSSDDGNSTGTWAPLPNRTISDRTFWQPTVNSTWQIVLLNPIELDDNATSTTPDVDVFDIDLFTNSDDTIDQLHALDKKVICYFSAGSYESGRPDSSQFNATDKGKELDGWPGEYWLQTNSKNVRNIMANRIQIASNRGCDAIDPDNIDGYDNDNGLGLTAADATNYMQFLSDTAKSYNMSTGLKNAAAIIPNVLNITHFAVNEQCVQYSECINSAPFVQANKPVFNIEYPFGDNDDSSTSVATDKVTTICSRTGQSAGAQGFSTVMKHMDLDGWVEYCDKTTATTATA